MKTVTMPQKESMTLTIKPAVVRIPFVGKGRKLVQDDKRRKARSTEKRSWRKD